MLTSLEIKNFRTFSHLFIERLGRVNLILGKNNVGKTTLLEALWVYASVWPSFTIPRILDARDELGGQPGERAPLLLNAVFHGREAQEGISATIGPCDAGANLPHLRITAGFTGRDTAGLKTDLGAQGPFAPRVRLVLNIECGERKFRLFTNGGIGATDDPSESLTPPEFDPSPPFLRGLSTEGSARETATRWDAIALTEGENRVLDALRTVAPVLGVSFVAHPSPDEGRMAKARVEGFSTPVPMAILGDGVVRMFQIAVALEYAALARRIAPPRLMQGNVFPTVLIDEVESGIHHTLHSDLWRFIFRAARLLDVQVFATTHSWDCLKGFAKAIAEDEENDGLAIRLEKVEGEEQTGAVIVDREGVPIVVRDSIEVR